VLYFDDWVIDELISMIDRGETHKNTSYKLGISESTIPNILRNPYNYRISNKKEYQPKVPLSTNVGPYYRCKECGHEVQMPCKICEIRKYTKFHRMKV